MLPQKKYSVAAGIALSVAYGLASYLRFDHARGMPTISFLIVLPAVMGAIPLLFADVEQIKNYLYLLLIPWFTIGLFFLVLYIPGLEALVCLVVLASPFIFVAMLGTLIAWIIRAFILRSAAQRRAAALLSMLLPFAALGIERGLPVPEETVRVVSSTVVAAPAGALFRGLAEVDTIEDAEYQVGIWNRLGVPRPIRATVDRAALGGRRTGQFEYGLRFDEVITTFDAPRTMAFDIAVDPSTLRPNSTERHALEGGYFRFVDATYTIEPVDADRVRLTLASRYVVRSTVKAYGNLFGRALVGDFQDRVLAVLKRRAERQAPARSEPVAEGRAMP
jgi:hypothetical protein